MRQGYQAKREGTQAHRRPGGDTLRAWPATLFILLAPSLLSGLADAAPSTPTPLSPGAPTESGPEVPSLTPTLQWSAVAGADNYHVAVRRFAGSWDAGPIVFEQTYHRSTSIQLPRLALDPGQSYRWNVRAFDAAGAGSDWSGRLYFRTAPDAAPECVRGRPAESSVVTVGQPVTFEATCTDREARWGGIAWNLDGRPHGASDAAPTTTTWTSTRVVQWNEPGTHSMAMGAVDAGGRQSNYVVWSVRVEAGAPAPTPATVTGLDAGATSGSPPRIASLTPRLAWSASDRAERYHVSIRTGPMGQAESIDSMSAGPRNQRHAEFGWLDVGAATSYDVPAGRLAYDTEYRWSVLASNAAGDALRSADHTFRTPLPPGAPLLAPTFLEPGATSAAEAPTMTETTTLRWGAVEGASEYRVELRSAEDDRLLAPARTAAGTTLDVRRSELPADATLLRWRVLAMREGEVGPPSGDLYLRVAATSAPLPPRDCGERAFLRSGTGASSQAVFANEGPATVRLHWIDGSGSQVEHARIAPGAEHVVSTYASHVWLVTDDAGACFALYVAGEAPSRTTLSFTAASAAPRAPTGLSPGGATATEATLVGESVRLVWDTVPGATSYRVRFWRHPFGAADTVGTLVRTVHAPGPVYGRSDLPDGTLLRWTVTPYRDEVVGEESAPRYLSTSAAPEPASVAPPSPRSAVRMVASGEAAGGGVVLEATASLSGRADEGEVTLALPDVRPEHLHRVVIEAEDFVTAFYLDVAPRPEGGEMVVVRARQAPWEDAEQHRMRIRVTPIDPGRFEARISMSATLRGQAYHETGGDERVVTLRATPTAKQPTPTLALENVATSNENALFVARWTFPTEQDVGFPAATRVGGGLSYTLREVRVEPMPGARAVYALPYDADTNSLVEGVAIAGAKLGLCAASGSIVPAAGPACKLAWETKVALDEMAEADARASPTPQVRDGIVLQGAQRAAGEDLSVLVWLTRAPSAEPWLVTLEHEGSWFHEAASGRIAPARQSFALSDAGASTRLGGATPQSDAPRASGASSPDGTLPRVRVDALAGSPEGSYLLLGWQPPTGAEMTSALADPHRRYHGTSSYTLREVLVTTTPTPGAMRAFPLSAEADSEWRYLETTVKLGTSIGCMVTWGAACGILVAAGSKGWEAWQEHVARGEAAAAAEGWLVRDARHGTLPGGAGVAYLVWVARDPEGPPSDSFGLSVRAEYDAVYDDTLHYPEGLPGAWGTFDPPGPESGPATLFATFELAGDGVTAGRARSQQPPPRVWHGATPGSFLLPPPQQAQGLPIVAAPATARALLTAPAAAPVGVGYSLLLRSPANVLVVDEQGRGIGTREGVVVNEIPGASFTTLGHEESFLLPPGHAYVIRVNGTGEGTYTLHLTRYAEDGAPERSLYLTELATRPGLVDMVTPNERWDALDVEAEAEAPVRSVLVGAVSRAGEGTLLETTREATLAAGARVHAAVAYVVAAHGTNPAATSPTGAALFLGATTFQAPPEAPARVQLDAAPRADGARPYLLVDGAWRALQGAELDVPAGERATVALFAPSPAGDAAKLPVPWMPHAALLALGVAAAWAARARPRR